MNNIKVGQIWQHKQTGDHVEVISHGKHIYVKTADGMVKNYHPNSLLQRFTKIRLSLSEAFEQLRNHLSGVYAPSTQHCDCGEELTPVDTKGKCDNCLKQPTKTDIKIGQIWQHKNDHTDKITIGGFLDTHAEHKHEVFYRYINAETGEHGCGEISIANLHKDYELLPRHHNANPNNLLPITKQDKNYQHYFDNLRNAIDDLERYLQQNL